MRFHICAFIAALTLSLSVTSSRAQYVAESTGEHPVAALPADVQLDPLFSNQSPPSVAQSPTAQSYVNPPPQQFVMPATPENITPVAPSYVAPMSPGAYPNIPASWNEYDAAAQPAVPMPCEGTSCNNDPPWTHWYFEADLVGFSRGNDARNQGITASLSTTDLNFGMVAGPYTVLGVFTDPHNQWQLVYFIAPGMSANEHRAGVDANYDSTFQSAELNYLHTWNHWSFLAGFRYLHLDEQFRLSEVDTFSDEFFDMRTANDLYGGQLGFAYHREWSWILLDLDVKFGIYGNSAVQHGTVTQNGSLIARGDEHPSATSGSFEFDLFLGHRFSPHWMGRLGLVTLGVSNVALAPDMNRTSEADGGIGITGLTLGVLGQW